MILISNAVAIIVTVVKFIISNIICLLNLNKNIDYDN